MIIKTISRHDFELFWPTFKKIIEAQDSYAFDPDMGIEQAYRLWCEVPLKTFVATFDTKIAASYYLKPNAAGPGSHICNCGYMVSADFRGQGIARKLCEHSQQVAIQQGFSAMQFNSVVSTNKSAIHLWKSMGFTIIGTIPEAYIHKSEGFVDAFIMHKSLD